MATRPSLTHAQACTPRTPRSPSVFGLILELCFGIQFPCSSHFSIYQDFLQVLSIFASFRFDWPPALVNLYNSISLASFNLELLAPECSFSVNYEAKWLVTQSLPLILLASVAIVLVITRILQFVQRTVFHVLPFGAVGELSLVDVCIGVLISGSYYLYFRTYIMCVGVVLAPSLVYCVDCESGVDIVMHNDERVVDSLRYVVG